MRLIPKIFFLCLLLVPADYSTEIEQPDELSSYVRQYVSSAVSAIGKIGNYILTPEERPSWKEALFKTGIGLCGVIGIEQLRHEQQEYYSINTGYWTSTGLLFTGLRETFYLIYARFADAQALRQASRIYPKGKFKGTALAPKKYDQIIQERNRDLERCVRASKYILCSTISLYSLYNYDNIGNTLSFLGEGFFQGLANAGINLAILETGLFTGALLHNLNELKFGMDDRFLTYSPISEIVNGFVLMGVMGQILGKATSLPTLNQCLDKYIDIYTNILSKDCYINQTDHLIHCNNYSNLPFVNKLNEYAKYNAIHYPHSNEAELMLLNINMVCVMELSTAIASHPLFFRSALKFVRYFNSMLCFNVLSMIKKNINEYINPVIVQKESLNLSEKSNFSLDRQKGSQQKRYYSTEPSIEENAIPCKDCTQNDNVSLTSLGFPQESKGPRKKIKTRGAPDLSKVSENLISQISTSPIANKMDSLNKGIREAGLKRVEELRMQYPIKETIIDRELNQAATFLDGHIVKCSKNTRSLEWVRGKNRFSMHYEAPHGNDSNNYIGNRRNRVLNVLKTSYLVGLSEEAVIKYIEEHNFHELYRVDKFMHFILTNRTR